MITPFLFWGAYFDNVSFDWLKQGLEAQLATTNPAQLALLEPNTLMASEIISDIVSRTLTILVLSLVVSFGN